MDIVHLTGGALHSGVMTGGNIFVVQSLLIILFFSYFWQIVRKREGIGNVSSFPV
jgi:hypothetical protein